MRSKLNLCLLTAAIVLTRTLLMAAPSVAGAPDRQLYQLIVYHIKDKTQEERIDKYLSGAYLPAVHRAGIRMAGVFKTANIDTASVKKIYVLLTYRSLDEFQQITKQLSRDNELADKGKDYLDAPYNEAPYIRKEVILMEAFRAMPVLKKPEFSSSKANRIYELRSYEGATEKLYLSKVKMFNEGRETDIFERIGSQPMFYGEVLAGSRMPNLMYMTTYSDKKSRDEHWKTFGDDPDWKKLTAMPEYQHNVSKADIEFLVPADYSDL